MKHPWLICFIHKWNTLLLQRNKVVKKELLKSLVGISTGKVFDAGCGEGMFIFPYTYKFTHVHFIGLDKNKNHIDFCQKYRKNRKLENASFICQNFAEEVSEKDIDVLLCIGTLQYVENDEVAIANFYKSIKKNGKAIIYTPINGLTILPVYRHFFDKTEHYETSQNRKRVYSEKEITDKLKATGFEIISRKYTYGKWGILGHEIYSLLLFGVANGRWFSVIFIIVLLCFLPLILALNFIDDSIIKINGNGLLIVAKK